MKFVLKHPLQFGETSITELKLREHALASDYLAFDKSGGVAQKTQHRGPRTFFG